MGREASVMPIRLAAALPGGVVALVAALALPPAAAAQEAAGKDCKARDGADQGGSLPSGEALQKRLTLCLDGDDFTIRPLLRFDLDGVSFFGQDRPGGFDSGTQVRRARLGAAGNLPAGFGYRVIWEFGGYPGRTNFLYEAQLTYKIGPWGMVRAGAYTPQHLPEYAASSFDLLFLERSAISNIVAGLASGDSREALGLEAHGRDWNLSLYGTGGTSSALHDHRQRGLAGRAVAASDEGGLLHLQAGFDVAAQFDPGTVPGNDTLRLRDYPELRGDGALRFLDTRSMGAQEVYAYGPELSGTIGPLYVEALYQQIVVDRGHGGTSRFDGWYAQAALPLLPWNGKRRRSAETGTWRRPATRGWAGLDGHPGALELAARYSTVDLNDGAVRGGTQSIWTVGLNWYLSENLKVQTQYQNGRVALDGPDRLFQAWAVRLAFNL